MKNTKPTMAQQVAQAVSSFQEQQTGHTSKTATAILNEDTLVVTLHDALTPAEKALARTPEGAAKVQEFHRQLFANSLIALRQEIKRITGVHVREAVVEVEPATGAVAHAFAAGTIVQIFMLANPITTLAWNGVGPS